MTYIKSLAVTAALLSFALTSPAQTGPQKLPATRLTAGFHLINAEVASTPEQRATGLMNRPTMPANDGMLFVFERAGQQCFWMKNTLLPLSIAFLDDDGTIVNIEDMKPQTLDSHCSAKPVRFALEMNQGWFGKRAIKPGAKITGAPFGSK
jgi:uncharacterized membrane protein (UPF0127 family)